MIHLFHIFYLIHFIRHVDLLAFIQSQGYFIIFILMFFEGPIVTYAAAFAASLGVFNIWIIFILALFGNIVPDTVLYSFGRFSRGSRVERWVETFGLTNKRMAKIEGGFMKNTYKTLLIIKLTPLLPAPGLILSGFMKVSFRKFLLIDIIFNVAAALIFTALGFYSGVSLGSITRYLKMGWFLVPLFVILIIIVYFILKKINKAIAKKEYIGKA